MCNITQEDKRMNCSLSCSFLFFSPPLLFFSPPSLPKCLLSSLNLGNYPQTKPGCLQHPLFSMVPTDWNNGQWMVSPSLELPFLPCAFHFLTVACLQYSKGKVLLCQMHAGCTEALRGLMNSFVASPAQEAHE